MAETNARYLGRKDGRVWLKVEDDYWRLSTQSCRSEKNERRN